MAPRPHFGPALVTGASGFIGACLVRRLLAEGWQTHVLLRRNARLWRLRGILHDLYAHEVDLSDAGEVQRTVAAIGPGAVFHLAAYGAYEAQSDPRLILGTDVLGTYNVLAASLAAGARAFVNAGSSSEYGYKAEPMRESDRLEPNSVYAVAKAAQTHLCSLYGRTQTGTGIVTFRLFSVFGPWEEPTRLFPTLLRRAQQGLPLEMVSPDTARDFVYVDDVLDAFLRLSDVSRLRGEVFNLGSGVQHTMQEVVAAVKDVTGCASEVRWGAMAARRWDTSRWQADAGQVREALGWSARHSLRDGVAKMWAWMRETGLEAYGAS